jgi:hypothetical protein
MAGQVEKPGPSRLQEGSEKMMTGGLSITT